MIKLSVNINKVATVRNSRGGSEPSVLEAARVCVRAGAPGLTVHPREDARHITFADVRDVAAYVSELAGKVEYNIEGDPRPELVALVHEVKPTQCTLVPVRPGELTSEAGWTPQSRDEVGPVVRQLRDAGIRVSLFVDPSDTPIRWAADLGADRVELYTEPFARAFERAKERRPGVPVDSHADARASFATYAKAAELAHSLGLGVNAGHDLNLENLAIFKALPHLDEVSIGHALISHALFVGLEKSVREYLHALRS